MEDKSKITDAEWEVMRVVWTLEEATSKDIAQVLQNKKGWKLATTKTLIGRLVQKGMLNTNPKGKRYIYTAAINKKESIQILKDELFQHICSKEVGKWITSMISDAVLSHSDISMLEETIQTKKKEAVEEVECNCVPGQCLCKQHHHHH